MALTAGSRLGPYEIIALIGAGGMGEVYRAHDPRLRREVALKALPARLAQDGAAMERFRREAQTLAALNHPGIAAVYGFEDGALAMELVEGETLAERIRRGALPLEEAVPLARQLAEAIEYAHERGIIHRDLKPANIKLTGEGQVKVLDFGLAKALAAEATSAAALADSPTLSHMQTQAGVILGTAAYMSPEQAKGKAVDRRGDIWAFGCVLFEMLAGGPAFAGETVTDVLAAVVRAEPDWTRLPAATPPWLRDLLARSLRKDARQRLQAIGDARIALSEAAGPEAAATADPAPRPPRRAGVAAWLLGGLAGAVLVALGGWLLRPPPAPSLHFRAVTGFAGVQMQPALSPDGRSVAFVSNRDANYNIYVGLIGGGNLVQVTDSPNLKARPAWSPDGAELAYAQINAAGLWDIWEVPALGGAPRRLILNATDPAWSPDGAWLAYQAVRNHGLWMARASGQDARQIAGPVLDRNTEPRFSPDGREIAMAGKWGGPYGRLFVVEVATGKVRQLTNDLAMVLSPAWSPDGRWIYFASSRGGTTNIWKIAASGGTPQQLTAGQGDDAELDLSADGQRLVFATFHSGNSIAQLDLGAPAGNNVRLLTTDPARNQLAARYSPDGKHLVYFTNLKGVETEQVWTSNADGSNPTPLVVDDRENVFPEWSPDGRVVYFNSIAHTIAKEAQAFEYRRIGLEGGSPEVLLTHQSDYFDLGPSGRLVFATSAGGIATYDPTSKKLRTLPPLPAGQTATQVQLSPDGGAIAYVVTAKSENDPQAGLWVDDFKSPARQVFRGWVVACARAPHNEIYLLAGQPDLNGVLWKVGWNGQGLGKLDATLPLLWDYWQPVPTGDFDVSPDGRHLTFSVDDGERANLGMIEFGR